MYIFFLFLRKAFTLAWLASYSVSNSVSSPIKTETDLTSLLPLVCGFYLSLICRHGGLEACEQLANRTLACCTSFKSLPGSHSNSKKRKEKKKVKKEGKSKVPVDQQ
jgi:hypothetical protein